MENTTNIPTAETPPRSGPCGGSASDYNPAKCLREEVARFKATNRFTPMDVTGFYIQAAVVLHEHQCMVEALREIRDGKWGSETCRRIAANSLPMSETARTPNSEISERREPDEASH